MIKIQHLFKNYRREFILGLMIVIYILYFTTASFLRHDNFYTGRFDLGNMDQVAWNTIHGRIFQMTDPNGTQVISRLAFHADFILILLSPFYFIWSSPKMLLLIQTLVLSFGAIFVFLLAKKYIKNKHFPLLLSLAYLINPAVNYTNLYDFHPVTLATTFLLGASYFLLNKKYFLFVIFAILSAITKEEIWIIIALFGFVIILKNIRKSIRKVSIGIILSIVSLFIFYLLIWKIIPGVRGTQHFALSYYSDFGDSPGSIVKNIIFSPQKTFGIIFQNGRLIYLLQLFSPVGFLSLLSPLFLILTAPEFAINLLSNNPQLHQIYYQYSSGITPFIFVSAIFGIARIEKKFPKLKANYLIGYFLITVFISAFLFGPLPLSRNQNIDMFTKPQSDKEILENFLSKIPQKYYVASTNNLGPHLSHRREIYTIPVGIDKADIVIFLLNDKSALPSLSSQIQMAEDLKKNKNYFVIFQKDFFIAFAKKGSTRFFR
ncbi:MAG: DUF2079 domain-containing protein [Candidatus Levyibacteriota bacterium]